MDARRRIDDANSKLVTINAEYDRLLREKSSFLVKMRTALESELAVTVQLLNGMPQSKEIDPSIIPVAPSPAVVSEAKSVSKPETAPKSEVDSDSQLSSVSIKSISSDMPVKQISIDK